MRERQKQGHPVPVLDNAPEIYENSYWYWKAYQILAGKRVPIEGGTSPIPMSEILAYVEYEKIDDEQRREDLLRVLNSLDDAYISFSGKQRAKSAREQKTKNAGLAKKR